MMEGKSSVLKLKRGLKLKKRLIIYNMAIFLFLIIGLSVKSVDVYFPNGTLVHTLQLGAQARMGIAYNPNTNTYWSIYGGGSPSAIYEQRPDGTFVTSSTVPLDGRAIVYRPEDKQIYIRTYNGGLYRLNLPFNGSVTQVLSNIFQNSQCGFAFADDDNVCFSFRERHFRENCTYT